MWQCKWLPIPFVVEGDCEGGACMIDELTIRGATFVIMNKAKGWYVVQKDPEGLGDVISESSKTGWVPAGTSISSISPMLGMRVARSLSKLCRRIDIQGVCLSFRRQYLWSRRPSLLANHFQPTRVSRRCRLRRSCRARIPV